jgi:excisionase family DNA binding protein
LRAGEVAVSHELVRGGLAQGKRNAELTRLVGHLLRRRVDPRLTLELVDTTTVTNIAGAPGAPGAPGATPATAWLELGVSAETVLRWTRAGVLPAIKLPGGAIRFRPEELAAWIEDRATPGRGDVSHRGERRPRDKVVGVSHREVEEM